MLNIGLRPHGYWGKMFRIHEASLDQFDRGLLSDLILVESLKDFCSDRRETADAYWSGC